MTKGLNGLLARRARLLAEQEGLDRITFPPELMDYFSDPEVRSLIGNEVKLFQVRSSGRVNQKAQLKERIAQLKEEIGGLEAQENAKSREIELIQKELVGVRDLYAKEPFVQISRLTVLERDAARLDGDGAVCRAEGTGQGQDYGRSNCRSFRSTRTSRAKSPRKCARSTTRSVNSSSAR